MIPYTVHRRSDTGVSNVTMGIWLFLASEVMLFGSLFSAYALLRVSAESWPHGRDALNVWLGLLNTAILFAMTGFAWKARASEDAERARKLLSAASVFAIAFLVVKGVEYGGEISRGMIPSRSMFLAIYFVLTGFHAAHVAGGLLANAWAITGRRRVGPAMTVGRIHALGLYWAFVDVVWLTMFGLLYLS